MSMRIVQALGALLALATSSHAGTAPAALEWQMQGCEPALRIGGVEVARLASPRLQRPDGTNIPTSGLRVESAGADAAELTAAFSEDLRLRLTLHRGDSADTLVVTGQLESQRPIAVAHLALPVLVPIGMGQTGGTWAAGGARGTFPLAFGGAVLHDGTPASVIIADGQGRTLEVGPKGGTSRTVIQDNRAWNWATFECQVRFPPKSALSPSSPLTFEVRFRADHHATQAKAIVDPFGQYQSLQWPRKVSSEADLRQDAAREAAALERVFEAETGSGRWDRFGGYVVSDAGITAESMGFFRTGQIHGRDWLMTPEGNPFFSAGVCALTTWDTFTPLAGREAMFAWLPDESSDARIRPAGGPGVSFYVANLQRKFGAGWKKEFAAMAALRFRAWGFNTLSAFGDRIEGMPYAHWRLREAILAAGTPIPETSYAGSGSGIIDIYQEGVAERLDQEIAAMVEPLREDRMLIGYFLGNEEFWDTLPATVAKLSASWACKRRLVAELEAHYGSLDALRRDFRTEARDWRSVAEEPIWAQHHAGRERLAAFGVAFAERYFELVTQAVRRHDPNHLILGARLLPKTADAGPALLRAIGKHCDVVSINYYTDAFEAERVAHWREAAGRPLLLSEWSYGAPGRGHTGGPRTVPDQAARAKAYEDYVAAAAASGAVVGCHWFEYLDQPVTGRMNEGDQGERYNVGLVDVTDRPYEALARAAARANRAVYDALAPENQAEGSR